MSASGQALRHQARLDRALADLAACGGRCVLSDDGHEVEVQMRRGGGDPDDLPASLIQSLYSHHDAIRARLWAELEAADRAALPALTHHHRDDPVDRDEDHDPELVAFLARAERGFVDPDPPPPPPELRPADWSAFGPDASGEPPPPPEPEVYPREYFGYRGYCWRGGASSAQRHALRPEDIRIVLHSCDRWNCASCRASRLALYHAHAISQLLAPDLPIVRIEASSREDLDRHLKAITKATRKARETTLARPESVPFVRVIPLNGATTSTSSISYPGLWIRLPGEEGYILYSAAPIPGGVIPACALSRRLAEDLARVVPIEGGQVRLVQGLGGLRLDDPTPEATPEGAWITVATGRGITRDAADQRLRAAGVSAVWKNLPGRAECSLGYARGVGLSDEALADALGMRRRYVSLEEREARMERASIQDVEREEARAG